VADVMTPDNAELVISTLAETLRTRDRRIQDLQDTIKRRDSENGQLHVYLNNIRGMVLEQFPEMICVEDPYECARKAFQYIRRAPGFSQPKRAGVDQ
jgi:hypothetical protein